MLAVGALTFVLSGTGNSGQSESHVSMQHVHGLGVDPADGSLYAGTHAGLFRLSGQGAAVRVGDGEQDFMGFAVAGAGRFLASGHPGPGQDGPASVGLIESTDSGNTWQSRSLSGQADFHALEYRHDRVYGVNALTGEFMVSDDIREWRTQSRLPMADFAVSPASADLVVATTESGPAMSMDGGRTFEPIPGAPLLLLVSWADDGTLVGVSPEGAVHASEDGQAWEPRASLDGRPEALAASEGVVYVAVDGSILSSGNDGRTFDVRHVG